MLALLSSKKQPRIAKYRPVRYAFDFSNPHGVTPTIRKAKAMFVMARLLGLQKKS
jgi:hypothetical protein